MPDYTLRDADPGPTEHALALAGAAMSAVRAGDLATAEDRLMRSLRGQRASDLPIAFYASALRAASCGELADRFQAQAMALGLDVAAVLPEQKARLLTMGRAEARRECGRYEAAFAAGAINPEMIGRYALALGRAGNDEGVAALLPVDKVFRHVVLDRVDGFASVAAFNSALMEDMDRHAVHSLYDGRRNMHEVERLRRVQRIATPAMQAFLALVRRELTLFADTLPLPDSHLLKRARPAEFKVKAWANIYRAGAHVKPHVHSDAWLVAVYYPQIPEGMGNGNPLAGALRAGCPDDWEGLGGGWPELTVVPVPGTLLIMPAYCYHWSLPFDGEGTRVALAVDWLWY